MNEGRKRFFLLLNMVAIAFGVGGGIWLFNVVTR